MNKTIDKCAMVSVPIWGLFNLTKRKEQIIMTREEQFPSPSGDYLI